MSTAPSSTPTQSPKPDSAWAPLAARVFRALWIAQLVSNIGSWMQMVGAQWLLIGHDAALVTLVQTASSLPVVLLALPSGVVADRYDRRRVLLAAQLAMLVVSGALTALARALGPAVGGVVVAAAGAGWVFAFNAASYLGIAAVLLLWRPPRTVVPAPSGEKLLTALDAGRRYVWYAPGIRRVLLRMILFIPGGAALWALLPLVASRSLHLGSGGYGLLLGAVGVGAVAGAFVLPRSNRVLGANGTLGSGCPNRCRPRLRARPSRRHRTCP
ncbi:MFS transporter [Streptomyces sp. NPDC059866]|uniref:MFS transporter n=1 Tax=Streptomyces sp. NPDC059866 TaxID=3346978 RepID=UPI00364CC164